VVKFAGLTPIGHPDGMRLRATLFTTLQHQRFSAAPAASSDRRRRTCSRH
jgi:hypothetical protein